MAVVAGAGVCFLLIIVFVWHRNAEHWEIGNSGAAAAAADAIQVNSATGVSAKFTCVQGTWVFELRPNGVAYLTLYGVTSAGTYSIDGKRINIVVNGHSLVFGFKDGKLNAFGKDCVKG